MEVIARTTNGLKLVFTSDRMPGYRRIAKGRGFAYVLPDGSVLSDRHERRRIQSLAVPPAYRDVWICMRDNGHLQATGIDARGRKQYRYHPGWHEVAADRKFGDLADFAKALPKIREAMRKELAKEDLTRERVIAGIVALLDLTGYRIGNSRYEKDNRSFGLSSLWNRHLQEADGQLILKFRGKAGSEHHAEINDPRLTQLVSELQDLPGQHLFRYEDEAGKSHDVETADVNSWLKETGGGEFTAKQFRTWKASLLCARELAKSPAPDSKTATKSILNAAIKTVAEKLHHTPATCRKYYIHPSLPKAFASGELQRTMNARSPRLRKADGTAQLRADERRLFKILTS